jgi:hypothetical protein
MGSANRVAATFQHALIRCSCFDVNSCLRSQATIKFLLISTPKPGACGKFR